MFSTYDAALLDDPTWQDRRSDPRETMRTLPRITQLPLTFLTGKAYPGQRPLATSASFHLGTAFVNMIVGAVVSCFALTGGSWWLLALLPGWAITLHGMRNLRMMIYHQCAHKNMWAHKRLDATVGKLCSSLLLVQNFGRYSKEHVTDHHAVHHMTLHDPTVQAFLVSLDLHPGMTRRQMWLRVLGKLVSPRFHLAFAISRLRSFAHGSDRVEKAFALAIYGGAFAGAALTGHWLLLGVGWFVVLFPLFQVSNTLRLCVKHTFPAATVTKRTGKEYFSSLTNAIFLGEATPAANIEGMARLGAWVRWGLRMAFVHFPARYLVLTGDTVVHDYHHRRPRARDWSTYLFARQQDVDEGHPGWPAYHEAWGLVPAINLVFDSLSVADATEFDVNQLRSVSRRELFAAFDD